MSSPSRPSQFNPPRSSISNLNQQDAKSITLLVPKGSKFHDTLGEKLIPNEEGELIIEVLNAGETKILFKDHISNLMDKEYPGTIERIKLFLQRSLVYISHLF